ncbi:MAG: hypothetical protein LBL82_01805 [Oscillospiraceae bacterium]|jgi:hypothetical protein|nr:hypothetical protein [Oscillospiraceae bacterium]
MTEKGKNCTAQHRLRGKGVFSEIINSVTGLDDSRKSHFVVIAAISLFFFVAYYYIDLSSLTVWSTNVWEVLFGGRFLDYYAYTAENHSGVMHQRNGAEFICLLPWSVWNLPIWIISKLTGVNIAHSYPMLLWSKLFLVAVLAATLRLVRKIAFHITGGKNSSLWAVFIMLGSIFTYESIYYAGQNDIFFVFLGVLGLYYLINKGEEKKFLLLFALSIAVKPFYIFVFIPILLLYEKNVWRILLKIAGSFGFLLLFKLLMLPFPMYRESIEVGPSAGEIVKILSASVDIFGISYIEASSFIACFVFLCFFCYVKDIKIGEKDFPLFALYAGSAATLLFSVFAMSTFYRPMMMLPMMSVLIAASKRRFKLNMILLLLLSAGIAVLSLLNNDAVFAAGMLFSALDKGSLYKAVTSAVFDFNGIEYIANLFGGVVLACAILLILLNFPGKLVESKLRLKEERCDSVVIWLYTLLPAVFLIYNAVLQYVVLG